MKITKTQLTRIVKEELTRRLRETEQKFDVAGEHAEFLGSALVDFLRDDDDIVVGNAWEMMIGTVGEDHIAVPSRIEDLDGYADGIVQKVFASAELKDVVKRMARQLLQSAMSNFGSGGPGAKRSDDDEDHDIDDGFPQDK